MVTSDLQWFVSAAGAMEHRPTDQRPMRVTMSHSMRAFFSSDISPPTNLDCGAHGSGRPAYASKSSANSMNDLCQCALGPLSAGVGRLATVCVCVLVVCV